MATTVKPIEAKAVHRIQAGQVIVDLCSVVKELVENSLDAGATVLEVRFKNNGLDEIEVQDNGSGIAPANYDNVALKHHTSKLATYDDLENLSTFGFRGEALSSLCALSKFNITTALESEAPKGHRLEFESSGKLKSTVVVACQRGTTATVSGLFDNLPVRRKELTKNVKREYGKVLGLLHAYACVSTKVKFTVKNSIPKGKSTVVFATNSNGSTRENIANIYGAKTLSALAQLDLKLSLDPSESSFANAQDTSTVVVIKGHISKPVFGEGRQTPDRQMFFVNGRPCGLPQVAKAINEVYKSFNVSQSPFIFADLQMDTKAYDVNVSPDKRSIFLHNASALIDALKVELATMFDQHEQTLPQSQLQTPKTPAYRQLSLQRMNSEVSSSPDLGAVSAEDEEPRFSKPEELDADWSGSKPRLTRDHVHNLATAVDDDSENSRFDGIEHSRRHVSQNSTVQHIGSDDARHSSEESDTNDDLARDISEHGRPMYSGIYHKKVEKVDEPEIFAIRPSPRKSDGGVVQNTYDRTRPKRAAPEMATITIGNQTVTRLIGSSPIRSSAYKPGETRPGDTKHIERASDVAAQKFSQRLGKFSAGQSNVPVYMPDVESSSDPTGDLVHSSENEDYAEGYETGIALSAAETSPPPSSFSPSAGNGNHDETSIGPDQALDRRDELDRVTELIRAAEKSSKRTDQSEAKRAAKLLRGGKPKDLTVHLQTVIQCDIEDIAKKASSHTSGRNVPGRADTARFSQNTMTQNDEGEEEKLSLTVSKSDFAKMSIVGQFNLGFILAVRSRELSLSDDATAGHLQDELFIIDQHASDEKYNFERLQAETVVGNQRMVRPVTLDLTAVEEEILIDSGDVLEKNGFIVEIDVSGDRPVGERCQLVSLPLSKEVVFTTKDLDELVHLLAESPMLSTSKTVPRPSKVRKMFAMRACRSSIMIGKTLSPRQMAQIVQHMGTIDKPWNCPHGRPTMRHLASLDTIDAALWQEGDGLSFGHEDSLAEPSGSVVSVGWREYTSEQE